MTSVCRTDKSWCGIEAGTYVTNVSVCNTSHIFKLQVKLTERKIDLNFSLIGPTYGVCKQELFYNHSKHVQKHYTVKYFTNLEKVLDFLETLN